MTTFLAMLSSSFPIVILLRFLRDPNEPGSLWLVPEGCLFNVIETCLRCRRTDLKMAKFKHTVAINTMFPKAAMRTEVIEFSLEMMQTASLA